MCFINAYDTTAFACGQGAALASSGRVQSLFGGKNPDSMKTPDENLQPKSLLTKESIEPETNWEGVQLRYI